MEFKPYSHMHPLRLVVEDITPKSQTDRCNVCEVRIIAAPFYVCDQCQYFVHKSCAELKQHINHPFHPSHPLTFLTDMRDYHCNSCRKWSNYAPSYGCRECDLYMDIKCTMMPTITPTKEGQKSIQHFSHPHSLLLLQTDRYTHCYACGEKCFGEAYGCENCDFFLHKSCSELPQQIKLPSHLGLVFSRPKSYATCNVCKQEFGLFCFIFECDHCKIEMCAKCTYNKTRVRRQSFKYKDHQHVLCFVEEICDEISPCNVYDGYCEQHAASRTKEFEYTKLWMWRCLDCYYILHLLCGPLPYKIKHQWHVDPLTLVDSSLKDDWNEDDGIEYYCDVCETKRDPRIRFYCCMDCKFFAHVHCVISEIIKVLTGEIEHNMELKTVGQDNWKALDEDDPFIEQVLPLTVFDLINVLTQKEQDMLREFYRWDEKKNKELTIDHGRKSTTQDHELVGDEEIDAILELSRFTHDVTLKYFSEVHAYHKLNKMELKSSDLSLTVVKVKGGYLIPRPLIGVFKTFINRYGYVGMNSYLSMEMKSFVSFIICKVLRGMRRTLVRDITRNILWEWLYHLRIIFQCDSDRREALWSSIRPVMGAFFGRQSKRLEDEIPAILNKKIVVLQKKLEKCKEYRSLLPKSKYMTYCLRKACELEGKHALEDLPSTADQSSDSDDSDI